MAEILEHFGTEPPEPGYTAAGEGRWTKRAGPDVAVIGGGPGGLFTSYILNQRLPQARVTIFEATGRLAGKIKTDQFSDGTPFEAGVAELYEYLGPGQKDGLRMLIEDDLHLHTVDMSAGTIVLGEEIIRDLDEFEEMHGKDARHQVDAFYKKCARHMPLDHFATRWQPDNAHAWANKTFCECIEDEVSEPAAREYILTAIHSDLACEAHTCNGLNGIKNALMDNPKYMKLYHVVGGLSLIPQRLLELIHADIRLDTRVYGVSKNAENRYEVVTNNGVHDFDCVIVCLPNHWLRQVKWGHELLDCAMQAIEAHYDLPAHYFRVSMLYATPWWNRLEIPGDYWMMDCLGGVCVYNESHRWKSRQGHVLSFLLAGTPAMNMVSCNWSDAEIVDYVLMSLPQFMASEAIEGLIEAQVDRYVGAVNAQPGGWTAEELRGEHCPECQEHPGLFLCGDHLFDSTLNATLMSASTAVDCLLQHLGVKGEKGTPAIEELVPDPGTLSH
jgi:monoamine oxidase